MQSPKQLPITEPSWLENELVTLGTEINPARQRQRVVVQVWQLVQTILWSLARACLDFHAQMWSRTSDFNRYPPKPV